jgi:hypothetical protein
MLNRRRNYRGKNSLRWLERSRQPSEKTRAQPDVVLQARPAPHSNLPAKPLRLTQALVGLEKLMDGKLGKGRSLVMPSQAGYN